MKIQIILIILILISGLSFFLVLKQKKENYQPEISQDVFIYNILPFLNLKDIYKLISSNPAYLPLIQRYFRRIGFPFIIRDSREVLYFTGEGIDRLANFFNLFLEGSAVIINRENEEPFLMVNIKNLPVSFNPLTMDKIRNKNPVDSKIKIYINNIEDDKVSSITVNIRNDLFQTRQVNYRELILPEQSYQTIWLNEEENIGYNYLLNELGFVLEGDDVTINEIPFSGSKVFEYTFPNLNLTLYNFEDGYNKFFSGSLREIDRLEME